jgi:hypothetical protein
MGNCVAFLCKVKRSNQNAELNIQIEKAQLEKIFEEEKHQQIPERIDKNFDFF